MLQTVVIVVHLLVALGVVALVLLQQGRVRTLVRLSVRVLRQLFSKPRFCYLSESVYCYTCRRFF